MSLVFHLMAWCYAGCPALFRGKNRTVGQLKKKKELSRIAQKKVGQPKKSRTIKTPLENATLHKPKGSPESCKF